jgi:hypothetical protein
MFRKYCLKSGMAVEGPYTIVAMTKAPHKDQGPNHKIKDNKNKACLYCC